MEHIDYTYTAGMDESEVEKRLLEADTGVLALADGDEAYAIPLAHHYDGDSLLFRLIPHEGSTKMAFLETTETARYVVYDYEPSGDSWSVVVTGEIRELGEGETAGYGVAELNELFPAFRLFGEEAGDLDVALVELSIHAATGRRSVE